MGNIFGEMAGMMKSKGKLTMMKHKLTGKAGGEGVVGRKNYNTQYRMVSKMVDQGHAREARKYMQGQGQKVRGK